MIPLIALGVALLPFALWCGFQFGHRAGYVAGVNSGGDADAVELAASLRAVVNNHCSNPRLFCSTCTHARELLARVERPSVDAGTAGDHE